MIKVKFAFTLMLGLLITVAISHSAAAQPLTEPPEGVDTAGNQTMASNVTSSLIPYSNPNLGFTLEYPSNWTKQESLVFISPQGGTDNRFPEVISINTEVLPSSDFSLDRYSEAALGQMERIRDFKLLNSSSTTLAGLPAHKVVYTFTGESQTPLQNLHVWTVKDGIAYIVTYNATPEEFDSSLPALQSVLDTFRLEEVRLSHSPSENGFSKND
jgi:hypothetical protein